MPVKKTKKKTVSNKKAPAVKKNNTRHSIKKRLEELHEKIMNTSWHHLQTESTIKQFFDELIRILEEGL